MTVLRSKPLLAESTHVTMPTERWLVGNVISILDHAVIDTYVQRTTPGRYTCQINQLISRQDLLNKSTYLTSR